MTNLSKKALLAAAGLSAVLALAPAHAYVMSESLIDITNFRILGSDGLILDAGGANTATPTGDFSVLTFTGTATQTVALNSGPSATNSASNPPTSPIDFSPICVGTGCNPLLPNDSFPKLTATPTGNYAAADQKESGAPVVNLTGFTPPASVSNVSASALISGSDGGHSSSSNNLNSSFQFVLGDNQTTGITFAFNANGFLQVAMSADEIFPGTATSSYLVAFTLMNQDTQAPIFSWNVDIFDNGFNSLSLNAPLLGGGDVEAIFDTGGADAFSRTTAPLSAGVNYQLSARINTNSDVLRQAAVPEPGILSLLGISLLAFGISRARRKSSLG